MSADLFEAFGDGSRSQPPQTPIDEKPAAPRRQDTGLVYTRRIEPEQRPCHDEPLWTADEGGNDVLFDATDEASPNPADDDFGDFEDVEQHHNTDTGMPAATNRRAVPLAPPLAQPESTLIDLLSLDDTQPQQQAKSQPYSGTDLLGTNLSNIQTLQPEPKPAFAPSQPDDDDGWGDFEDVSSARVEPSNQKQVSVAPKILQTGAERARQTHTPQEEPQDDDWDAFEDGEPSPAPRRPKKSTIARSPLPNSNPSDDTDWDLFEDGTPSLPTNHTHEMTSSFPPNPARPTNIPPPSTLLSLLSSIYATLSAPSPSPTPTEIIHLYHSTASITAARSHRWRRDTLLAQSTRISVASSGPKGGLKLSSLNKGEAAREEREARETLEGWNKSVAKWWGLLKGDERVKGRKGGLRLTLPLVVRAVSAKEGGMEAAYVCPVCGMKRSERVVGADDGVEDVFGGVLGGGVGTSELWGGVVSMERAVEPAVKLGS